MEGGKIKQTTASQRLQNTLADMNNSMDHIAAMLKQQEQQTQLLINDLAQLIDCYNKQTNLYNTNNNHGK